MFNLSQFEEADTEEEPKKNLDSKHSILYENQRVRRFAYSKP